MRVNPYYNNICFNRIGMYRDEACYDCPKLSECDQHYNNDGTWDYPQDRTLLPACCLSKTKVKRKNEDLSSHQKAFLTRVKNGERVSDRRMYRE